MVCHKLIPYSEWTPVCGYGAPPWGAVAVTTIGTLQIGLVQRLPLLLRLAGKLKKQRPRYGARETLVGPVAGEERG